MASDGSFDELHEFAARLGLRRAWFQRDHYDLPAHGRAAPSRSGAVEVATGELLLRMAGPRGDRARRRALAPGAARCWLDGAGGPAVLRYPAGRARRDRRAAGRGQVDAGGARDRSGARARARSGRRASGRRRAMGGGAGALARGAGRGAAGGRRGGRGDDGAPPRAPARAGQGRRGGGRSRRTCSCSTPTRSPAAGRAAQGAPRISDVPLRAPAGGWTAYRRSLASAPDPRRSPRSRRVACGGGSAAPNPDLTFRSSV